MSSADSQWPSWLRHRTGIELLGPPRTFFAWVTIALSLVVIVYVGAWNAAKYPVPLGYDAQPNADYMHILLDEHHIPRREQSAESSQPPAYYFFAEIAARAGHETFGWLEARPYTQLPEASYRGAQIMNVALVVLTALCVLWLARLVAPDRPWVWGASLGFFAFVPVVSKTEAMIHPENLNLLAAAAAVAAATSILVRRRVTLATGACLGASSVIGLATRASIVFILVAIVLGFGFSAGRALLRRSARTRWVAVAASTLVLAGALGVSYARIHSQVRADSISRAAFFSVSGATFTAPWRPNFVNQAVSTTYSDLWGDWFGSFSWSVYSGSPWPPTQRVLRDQALIGVIPTVFALGGWLGLVLLTIRGRRHFAVLALVPVVATTGYLVRSWISLTSDGDLLKATYLVNTAPVWAICFGLATAAVASRSRVGRFGMIALFAVFAVLELRFTLYGIRDHQPIF